jgi:hypothetical protein
MPKACEHNIPETKKGAGPCSISFEVKKRNGKPNWWCRTHGMDASAPDGAALESCPGVWFDPVPEERQCDLDVSDGVFSVWGGLAPAIQVGDLPHEEGHVHVHHRSAVGQAKDVDGSYDIVRITNGETELVVESMAAAAFSISELAGQPVKALRCPKSACGGWHIDEQKFATFPHSKHLCNSCGRNFRDSTPSISNPLATAYETLGLHRPPASQRPDRPLHLDRTKFLGIALWPSNSAIVSNSPTAEDEGIHVHTWNFDGDPVHDETYWPVFLDGEQLDLDQLRALAVQRALVHETPIVALPCSGCGNSLLSPQHGWIEPVTSHVCSTPGCGAVTKTRRRVFINPLADK